MTEVSSSLAELVGSLKDGIAFYRDAAGKVSDPELSEFFQRMGKLKEAIAADLNAEIELEGDDPREKGSLLGGLRQMYADTLARLGDDTAREYVAQLEDHEDRMLARFREAALANPSSRVRELALVHFPEIEKMHAQMRRLKQNPGHQPPLNSEVSSNSVTAEGETVPRHASSDDRG